ncbi:uncharacterized protein LOC119609344 isoform X2 [Lucilia sericata]|uniref:uncharacterized protein LOC119609344 isoform X2 n=1 Tax=Lucilia sericata TaxID=13632 RepID=UPI0018A809EB|nr:uncharacterized protein LOC119609344 isoform X2 [Lucilia sericata]
MCKFTNRLFVFALSCLLSLQMVCVWAKPIHSSSRDDAEDLGTLIALSTLMNSQDVHYDQRQKGDENYRIKLDGFFIGLPQEDSSTLLLLTDDLFESIALGKNKPAAKGAPTSSAASSSLASSAAADSSPAASENNLNLSSNNALNPSNNLPEIPAPKKYLEARHGLNSGSRTKSYIAQFLKLLKRVRKH